MSTQDFLFEIGTEELPAKALAGLIDALADGIGNGLKTAGLAFAGIDKFCAPRRLAVRVNGLQNEQAAKTVEKRGPALNAAYDASGNPTPAAVGFARSNGVDFSALEKLETDKGAWLVYRAQQAAVPAVQLLPAIVSDAVSKLPIPKPMRWGDTRHAFLRPVHWLVALLGDRVVDLELFGLKAGRETFGHRYHAPQSLQLGKPADYEHLLREQGRVVAPEAARKQLIRAQVQALAEEVGGVAVVRDDLLDEVIGLVEWPVALRGTFESRFLAVPQECLISTMADNQRYFHIVDAQGKLMPYFITISNIDSKHAQSVISGNEKVIRPRFADAEFFFQQDKKKRLDERLPLLANMVFQEKLGTLLDKSERVALLAAEVARRTGVDTRAAQRAGELCKADLITAMVGEFPELQGIMGEYYARNDGEADDVAQGIREHYLPRYSGDALPASGVGLCVAIADRLDTLSGIFGIGQAPTGAKDPFALRRAAIGLLRLCTEKQLDLDLRELIAVATRTLGSRVSNAKLESELLEFIFSRFRANYQDAGIATEIVNAVMTLQPTRPLDFERRVQAVQHFSTLPEAGALAAANKRVRNILAKSDATDSVHIDAALLKEPAEIELHRAIVAAKGETRPLVQAGDYRAVLVRLAALRTVVDSFFDDVMVNAEDAALRRNRHALLRELQDLFMAVADISQLPG